MNSAEKEANDPDDTETVKLRLERKMHLSFSLGTSSASSVNIVKYLLG